MYSFQAAKRLLHGRIEEMVKTLIQVMKNNVERPRKPFLPRDFEQGKGAVRTLS